MKGALTVVLFRLFTFVVSADEVKPVSVMKGDSVTDPKDPSLTSDRLKLDQTGSLTITNTDSGLYEGTQSFNVTVSGDRRTGRVLHKADVSYQE